MSVPDPVLLHEFIDRRWQEWRDGIALDIPAGRHRPARITATYAELVSASLAIGWQIRSPLAAARCRTTDPVVAILLPRHTIEAFAALLGIMREGAAYTAIEPAFPDGRVQALIDDAEAVTIVTDRGGAARLSRMGISQSRITVASVHAQPPAADGQAYGPTPDSLAYIIYTSGTTGRPKGVMVTHRAIANLVAGDRREFGIGPGDRVGQNSSHAYDSSIEEMWLALATGATVVVMDDDVARSGPDLVPWLERERLTVFCPPPTMLRATGVRSHEGLLPGLRLLYVGGEALTDDVVRVWAPGRRMVNGYGPTECTVVATRADIRTDATVTIGRTVPGMSGWILDESLLPVRPGEVGELCLGGVGLARGYWRRRELTAHAFPTHPEYGRIYRTGDRARVGADGNIVCLGRNDSQVKIRGYRVELEEIEARLAALPGIRSAASRMQSAAGRQSLVAFVVPEADSRVQVHALRGALASQLPAHMVPIQIGVLDSLPLTTGGKLDRASLPLLNAGPVAPESVHSNGRRLTPSELQVEMALRSVLRADSAIAPDAHFFQDLGGDSLLAAELVTHLRESANASALTVRDAYEAPTITSLAERMGTAEADPTVPRERPAVVGAPWLVTAVQCVWLTACVMGTSALGYLAAFVLAPSVADRIGALNTALLLPVAAAVAAVLYLPVSVALAVTVKRVFIGRYTAHRGPVWSAFYARNWMVRQSLRLVPWRLLEGTVFHVAALRALGARIGQRVHLHRGIDLLQGGWDLLEIGDDVTIGQEAIIQLVDLEDEQIVIAPVTIRAGATIDVRASVGGGATIEEGGYLAALSSLAAGARLPKHELWDGVPAVPAGQAPEAPAVDRRMHTWSPVAHGLAMLVTRLASMLMAPVIASLTAAWLIGAYGLDAAAVRTWLGAPFLDGSAVLIVGLAALLPAPLGVLGHLVLIRVLGTVKPGVIDRWSAEYFRVWAKTDLLRKTGDWLSGTLLWGIWLRAAGMRMGRDCEVSTIIDVVPELVTIGDGTFCADGIYLGGPRVHRGTVTLAETRLGRGLFLGNHVVIPAGSNVPDNILLGVCTIAHDRMEAGSAWFGHPPFPLSRPPQPPLDPSLTHRPSALRFVNRWFWELGRFAIPVAPALVVLALAQVFVRVADGVPGWIVALLILPVLVAAGAAAMCGIVLALKWLLLGRVQPGEHALWSCWCSRWDFHYTLWDRLATPVLSKLEGTLLLSWYLRATGMRIGKRVVLGPGFAQVVDPDMIQIDDDATVHALFQAHTFEDRLLKIDRVRIRARATVGSGAVVFYGVDIGEGASVAPQSVIMKRERLAAGGHYEGCPSRITTAD